ncbi:hypothetical protein ACA097_19645 [Pseudomonas sp. QL9]|uniref:hypothetical protein n=1 Tax=Pseudomonas sp. QL9 TaxID=3242725 RepID=UPI00352A4A58
MKLLIGALAFVLAILPCKADQYLKKSRIDRIVDLGFTISEYRARLDIILTEIKAGYQIRKFRALNKFSDYCIYSAPMGRYAYLLIVTSSHSEKVVSLVVSGIHDRSERSAEAVSIAGAAGLAAAVAKQDRSDLLLGLLTLPTEGGRFEMNGLRFTQSARTGKGELFSVSPSPSSRQIF